MTGDLARWQRLENYAKWKQHRFALDKLPSDVFAHVCSFLSHDDVSCVVTALSEFNAIPCIHTKVDALVLPVEIRGPWMRAAVFGELKRNLYSFAEFACFHVRHRSLTVHAYADWSPFSQRAPIVLATYGWTEKCTSRVRIAEANLCAHVNACIERRMCATRLTLHVVLDSFVLHELRAISVYLYPHGLL